MTTAVSHFVEVGARSGVIRCRRGMWLVCMLALAGLSEPAGAGELSLRDQAAAGKLYTAKCAKCHKFYEPKKYSDVEWEKSFAAMSRKSKLKPDQKQLLQQYLADYRAGKVSKIAGMK